MILGQGEDAAQGDGGDDWMEGGDQPDLLQGDSGTLFFTDRNTPGHDVTIGQAGDDDYDVEGGDDVMVADPGIEKSAGAAGYDWYTGARDPQPQNADLNLRILPPAQTAIEVRDRFGEVEALSGGPLDDALRGDDVIPSQVGGGGFIGCDALDQDGLDRISGLDPIVPDLTVPSGPIAAAAATHECGLEGPVWGEGNIILGGAGSDTIEGRGADDIIDGDRYLDVRLSVRTAPADPGTEIGTADLMESTYLPGDPTTLQDAVMSGGVDPGRIVIVREILTPAPGTADVDTAVFSDVRSAYDVTTNGDGSLRVDHARPSAGIRGDDGADTLRNVEKLEFADVTVDAAGGTGGGGGGIANAPATGSPTVTGNVAEGSQLTAGNGTIVDAEGISGITFAWEVEDAGGWTPVGTGATFTPGQPQVGRRLRVLATVTDVLGAQTVLASLPTVPVANLNQNATGAPVVTDAAGRPLRNRPRVPEAIGVDLSGIGDPDGLPATLQIQWQQSDDGVAWSNIPGATGETFTPAVAQVGDVLRVHVTFTDLGGSVEAVDSAPTRDVRPARGRDRALALTRASAPGVLGARTAATRGVPVSFTAPVRTQVVRTLVFRGRSRQPIARVFTPVRQGRARIMVNHPAVLAALRRPGLYRIEMTPVNARAKLGRTTVLRVRVRR
jgi:hypothetical protein